MFWPWFSREFYNEKIIQRSSLIMLVCVVCEVYYRLLFIHCLNLFLFVYKNLGLLSNVYDSKVIVVFGMSETPL